LQPSAQQLPPESLPIWPRLTQLPDDQAEIQGCDQQSQGREDDPSQDRPPEALHLDHAAPAAAWQQRSQARLPHQAIGQQRQQVDRLIVRAQHLDQQIHGGHGHLRRSDIHHALPLPHPLFDQRTHGEARPQPQEQVEGSRQDDQPQVAGNGAQAGRKGVDDPHAFPFLHENNRPIVPQQSRVRNVNAVEERLAVIVSEHMF